MIELLILVFSGFIASLGFAHAQVAHGTAGANSLTHKYYVFGVAFLKFCFGIFLLLCFAFLLWFMLLLVS